MSVAIISKKTKLDARAAPEPDAACGPHEHKAVPIFFFLNFPSVHGAICVIALFYTDSYCRLRSNRFFNIFHFWPNVGVTRDGVMCMIVHIKFGSGAPTPAGTGGNPTDY